LFGREIKYYTKSLLIISIASVILFAGIVSLGFLAVTSFLKEDNSDKLEEQLLQTATTSELFADVAFNLVSNNANNSFTALDNYFRKQSGFRLVPNIAIDDLNFDNVPSLYFNNTKICSETSSEQFFESFVQHLKIVAGSDIAIYQRINRDGDMMLICQTFKTFDKEHMNYYKALNDGKIDPLIATIFKGQTFNTTYNMSGTIYGISFKRITDRRGIVVGMIGVYTKLSGIINFNNQFLPIRHIIMDSLSKNIIYETTRNNLNKYQNALFEHWLDSLSKSPIKSHSAIINKNKGFAMYYDGRLNWILASKFAEPINIAETSIRTDAVKMAFSVAILIIMIIIIVGLLQSSKFKKLVMEKFDLINDMVNKINHGKYLEMENSIIRDFYQGNSEVFSSELFDKLRKINAKFISIACEKEELMAILESNMYDINKLTNEISQRKEDLSSSLDNATDKFTDMTVKIVQLTSSLTDLSLWQNFNDFLSKLQVDAGTDKAKSITNNLKVKSNLILDKIEKIYVELNSLKKISDHSYLISINSSIFAEKANSNKLSLLSDEIRRLSESLSNTADQVYYLLSEAKNATISCNSDIEQVHSIIAKSPKSSDISEGILEISKYNEKVGVLARNFNKLQEDSKTIIKTIESGKTANEKSNDLVKKIELIAKI